jgi:hypothetical protein
MYSDSINHRKGFIKRAGAAIAAVFVASSSSRPGASVKVDSSIVGAPNTALRRVHAAKGAIERKV